MKSLFKLKKFKKLNRLLPKKLKQRYMIKLDPVQASHYELLKPINLVAGNVVRFKFVAPTGVYSGITSVFLSPKDGSGTPALLHFKNDLFQTNNCSATINGVEIISGVTKYPTDGKSYVIELTILSPLEITYIGRYKGSIYYCDFIFYDIEFIKIGVTETYELGNKTANYELPKENVYGLELVKNGNYEAGSTNWHVTLPVTPTWSDGEVRLEQADTYSTIAQDINVIAGEPVEIVGFIKDTGTARGYLQVRDLDNGSNIIWQGNLEGLNKGSFKPVGSRLSLRMHGGNAVGYAVFGAVSIKQVSNAIQYINIPENLRELMAYSDKDKSWLSVINYFEPPSVAASWTDNLDGSYSKNANTWGALSGRWGGQLVPAGNYRVTVTTDTTSMLLYTRDATDTYNQQRSLESGFNEFSTFVPLRNLWFDSDVDAGSTVKNIVFQREIKEA